MSVRPSSGKMELSVPSAPIVREPHPSLHVGRHVIGQVESCAAFSLRPQHSQSTHAVITAGRSASSMAATVGEVAQIRDRAEATRIGGDIQMVNWAAELGIRAERKAGELLEEMELKPGP